MKYVKRALILLTLSLCIQGCASLAYTTPIKEWMCMGGGPCKLERNKIYIGTRKDAEAIREYAEREKIFPAIDLPLSFALDTLFLPYTAVCFFSGDSDTGND